MSFTSTFLSPPSTMASVLMALLLSSASHAQDAQKALDISKGCKANPAVAAQCFAVTGKVMAVNGTPSIRIHPDGSKRVLGVVPAEREIMSKSLKDAISFDRSVHAQMLVCPLSLEKKGVMQSVCIESADHVEVLGK